MTAHRQVEASPAERVALALHGIYGERALRPKQEATGEWQLAGQTVEDGLASHHITQELHPAVTATNYHPSYDPRCAAAQFCNGSFNCRLASSRCQTRPGASYG